MKSYGNAIFHGIPYGDRGDGEYHFAEFSPVQNLGGIILNYTVKEIGDSILNQRTMFKNSLKYGYLLC